MFETLINDRILLMKKCLICKSEGGYPFCKNCSKRPFLVESGRDALACKNDLNGLKKTYRLNYAEIKNLNTSCFWDKRLSAKTSLKAQDNMTKDRIKTAFNFLPKNVRKVMDIGAGNGYIEELLSRKNIKLFANDISGISINKLKNNFKGTFRRQSAYDMRYPKGYFDALFALEVLEHVPPSRILALLKKFNKMLKNKGLFIISVPTNEGLEKMKNNPNGHVRTYTEELIKGELKISKFKVIAAKTLYAFNSFYTFKKILARIFKNRWKPNNIVILAEKI